MKTIFTLVLLLHLSRRYPCHKHEHISAMDVKLRNHLFSNLSIHTRPVVNQSKPIKIKLDIEISQIISVHEPSQQIEFKLWTSMKWHNEFVSWTPADWSGIKSLKVTSEHLWTPDITLFNDIDEKQESGAKKYNRAIHLTSDGHNIWNAPGIFKSVCNMDVRYFPFDVQYCVLNFGSWEYDATELVLLKQNSSVVTKRYIKSTEWDLVHVDAETNTFKYRCCPHPYENIAFKFVIHRRPLYYIFNVIIPCLIMMCLILFSFFLPPESGERITIVITVLLAFTVILQMINQSMPKNSDSAPVLLLFYLAIMAESTFSLITTCMVLIAHHKGEERWTTPLPRWVIKLMNKIAPPLGVASFSERDAYRRITSNHVTNGKDPVSNGNECKAVARLLTTSLGICGESLGVEGMGVEGCAHAHVDLIQHCKLDKILSEMDVITQTIHEREIQDRHEVEWKHFGRVLDRLFFFVTLTAFLLSSFSILLPAYFTHKDEDASLEMH